MLPQATGVRAALDREAARIRSERRSSEVLVGEFGFLNDGADPGALARELLGTIGEGELWFVDVTRRSGYRGRLLDTAVRSQTGGTRRATDLPGLLRDTGWIVLDLERHDLKSLALPFVQIVVGRAIPRSTSDTHPQLGL